MKALVDAYGRRVRKLRVSLTDQCNLRCHYCMPLDAKFMNEDKLLTAPEYRQIVEELCEYGLEEVRLTGGEPLMRKSFAQITEQFASLPLKKIGMTTNAVLLDRHFETLREHRVLHLNVSLDSLNAESFRKITHGPHLNRVLKNIERAVELGFNVKLNTVAMKGVNDHEIFALVDFAKGLGIEIRFLELMRIGVARDQQSRQFISAREMIDILSTRYELVPQIVAGDSTSFNYKSPCGVRVGFIASESQAFCGKCSRWRLSADGMLRACLLKDDGLSVRQTTPAARETIFHALLGMKPPMRPREVAHQMNTIGG